MFKFSVLALAAASLAATPALAQSTNAGFVGPRVELSAGVTDVEDARDFSDVDYNLTAGADAPMGDRFTIGADVDAANLLDSEGRTLGAGARLGYALTPNVLAYGRVGYSTVDLRHENLDGLNVGGGLNFRLTENAYANVEYRYSDFEHNVGSHGARLGVGLRF